MGTPFGNYIRTMRLENEMSIRSLARHLGLSHVYLGRVERGDTTPLTEEHWPKLLEVLPGVTEQDLIAKSEISRPITLDVSDEDMKSYQNLVPVLARKIQDHSLSDEKAERILKILSGND